MPHQPNAPPIELPMPAPTDAPYGPATEPITPPAQQEMPISGAPVPGMESYDRIIADLMREYAIPGGAVAAWTFAEVVAR